MPDPSERPDQPDVREFFGAHPDPPKRGLLTRVFRRVFREGLWIFVITMDLGRRFGAILLRTEYVIDGGCQKRGACCHHILLEWSSLFDRHRWLGKIVLWKMTRVYSFFDRGYTWEIQDGLLARVLGCHALQDDGACGEYRLRPIICRAFPELPLTGKPLLLKGCGYRFKRRDGGDITDDVVQIGRPKRLPPA